MDDKWLALATQSSQSCPSGFTPLPLRVREMSGGALRQWPFYPGKLASTTSLKDSVATKGEQSHQPRLERSNEAVKELIGDRASIGTAYEEASAKSLLAGPNSMIPSPVVANHRVPNATVVFLGTLSSHEPTTRWTTVYSPSTTLYPPLVPANSLLPFVDAHLTVFWVRGLSTVVHYIRMIL